MEGYAKARLSIPGSYGFSHDRGGIYLQGVHEGEQHRSVSQLTTYAQCSMRYYLTRMAGHRELPAGWTIQGLAVHSAVEEWEEYWRMMPLDVARKSTRLNIRLV